MAVAPNPEQTATAFEPERTLRDLIGKDTNLAEIFTEERIKACQTTIDTARDAFFDVTRKELEKLEAIVAANTAAAEKISAVTFEDIAALAANIKGHAELFGFTLVAAIGNHVVAYCEPSQHTPSARFRLLADLVRMLHVAIKHKIGDEHGVLARELEASLQKY